MIGIDVTDGASEKLRDFPERLLARLDGTMQSLGLALQDRVRDKLGGEVLHSRSGRLAAGVAFDVASSGDSASVALGIADVPYAAYQEYGFHGTETVRAHLRTIKEAFGRAIAPRQVAVRSFARRVDYPAHSFLRSALAEIAPDAVAQIDVAAGEEAAT
jgi:hypothetical protein